MDEATEHLRALARRIVAEALQRGPLRAALLTGSAGRGDADCWSDIDLLLYVDELPPEGTLEAIQTAVGGVDPVPKGPRTDAFEGVEFELDGVLTEISYVTVARAEWRLDQILAGVEELDSPLHKVALGVIDGLALHGEELIDEWRARLRAFPEPLRRAMIRAYWVELFPLWYWQDAIAVRDAELWRIDTLADGAFRVLGVLAALNRVYYSRFHLKRTRALTVQLTLAPANLADRIESLFRLPPREAADELGRLAEETQDLVAAELPDVDLPLRYAPGTRRLPWA